MVTKVDIKGLFGDLRLNDTVRAKTRVVDDNGWVHAERGDFGTVIDLRPGYLPTVSFRPSGTVYDVAPDEVEVVSRKVVLTAVSVHDEITAKFPLS